MSFTKENPNIYETRYNLQSLEIIEPVPVDDTPALTGQGENNENSDPSDDNSGNPGEPISVDGGDSQDPVVGDSDTQDIVDTENLVKLNELNNDILNKNGILSNRVNVILTGRFGNINQNEITPFQISTAYTTSEMSKIVNAFSNLSEDHKLNLFKSFDRYRVGIKEYISLSKAVINTPDFEAKKALKKWQKTFKVNDIDIDKIIEYGFSKRNHMITEKFRIDNSSNPFEWIPFRQKRLANDILNNNIYNSNADMNNDNILNVSDIVIIIGIILN